MTVLTLDGLRRYFKFVAFTEGGGVDVARASAHVRELAQRTRSITFGGSRSVQKTAQMRGTNQRGWLRPAIGDFQVIGQADATPLAGDERYGRVLDSAAAGATGGD